MKKSFKAKQDEILRKYPGGAGIENASPYEMAIYANALTGMNLDRHGNKLGFYGSVDLLDKVLPGSYGKNQ